MSLFSGSAQLCGSLQRLRAGFRFRPAACQHGPSQRSCSVSILFSQPHCSYLSAFHSCLFRPLCPCPSVPPPASAAASDSSCFGLFPCPAPRSPSPPSGSLLPVSLLAHVLLCSLFLALASLSVPHHGGFESAELRQQALAHTALNSSVASVSEASGFASSPGVDPGWRLSDGHALRQKSFSKRQGGPWKAVAFSGRASRAGCLLLLSLTF